MKEPTTKLHQCRKIFCEYLDEFSGAPERKEVVRRFMNATQISKSCAQTYYQKIKRELDI